MTLKSITCKENTPLVVTVGEQLSIKYFVTRNWQWITFKDEAKKFKISICKILYTNNANLQKIINDTKNSLSESNSNRGEGGDENIMKGLRESVVQLRDGTFYKLVVKEDGNIAETDEVVGKLKEGEVYDEGNNKDESGKAVPTPGAASPPGAASASSPAEGSPTRASTLAAAKPKSTATTDAAASSSTTTEADQSAIDTSNMALVFDTAKDKTLQLINNNKRRKLDDRNEEGASIREKFANYTNNIIEPAMLEAAKSCTQAQKRKCHSLLEEELEKKLKQHLDHYSKEMKDIDNRLVELEEEKDEIEKAMQNEKNEYLNNHFRKNRSFVMKGIEDKIAEEWEAFEEKRKEARVAHKSIVDKLPSAASLMEGQIIVRNVTTPTTLKKNFEKSKKYETWEASVELKYDRTRVTLSFDPDSSSPDSSSSDSSSSSSSSSTTTT